MAKKQRRTKTPSREKSAGAVASLELKGELVQVEWKAGVSRSGPPRKIHKRRRIPTIPTGPPTSDPTPSPPVVLETNSERLRRGRS